MAAKDWMPKVIMVLNIVVGFLAAFSGVLYILHYLDLGEHLHL